MQACVVISGKAIALEGLMHTAEINGGGRNLKKMAEAVVVNSIGQYANSELHAVRQESKERE